MDPLERLERKMDKRVDKPDKAPDCRPHPATSHLPPIHTRNYQFDEDRRRKDELNEAIKRVNRDAKCPYELSVLVKRPKPDYYVYRPPDNFSTGETSLSTPMPLTPQPVQLLVEQIYNHSRGVPRETFGELSALIGDQRVLITVPMLLLRDDSSSGGPETPNGQHPADVQWFHDAGRTYYIYVSWHPSRRCNVTTLLPDRALMREVERESQALELRDAKQSARRRHKASDSDE